MSKGLGFIGSGGGGGGTEVSGGTRSPGPVRTVLGSRMEGRGACSGNEAFQLCRFPAALTGFILTGAGRCST